MFGHLLDESGSAANDETATSGDFFSLDAVALPDPGRCSYCQCGCPPRPIPVRHRAERRDRGVDRDVALCDIPLYRRRTVYSC